MTTSRLPRVSVVMPTFERRAILASTVAAILEQNATAELVVVVDGCHDGSIELLEEIEKHDPRLRAVWIENQGQSAARDTGVRAASHPVVLLVDDDVRLAPGTVARHAAHHACSDDLVVLGYCPVPEPAKRHGGVAVR